MSNELFSVEVNEEGRRLLQRFAKLALLILIVASLFGALETVSWLATFQKALRFAGSQALRRNYLVTMAYGVVNVALQVVQVIFYRRFAVTAARSVAQTDAEGFNGSFRFLILQAVCFLLQIIVGLLFLLTRFAILF